MSEKCVMTDFLGLPFLVLTILAASISGYAQCASVRGRLYPLARASALGSPAELSRGLYTIDWFERLIKHRGGVYSQPWLKQTGIDTAEVDRHFQVALIQIGERRMVTDYAGAN